MALLYQNGSRVAGVPGLRAPRSARYQWDCLSIITCPAASREPGFFYAKFRRALKAETMVHVPALERK
jgi:hypothetical protein